MKHKMELEDLIRVTVDAFENCVYQHHLEYFKLDITNKYNTIVESQIKELSTELGHNVSSTSLTHLHETSVVEFYSWLIGCVYKVHLTENKKEIVNWIKSFTTKRDDTILKSLFFYRNQNKLEKELIWDTRLCNFDQYLVNLRCERGDLSAYSKQIARALCTVHTKQSLIYANHVKRILVSFDINKHLLTCKSIRRESISLKLDHEIDFREYIETFNILTIVENSKGKQTQLMITDLFNKFDLLIFSEREEAIIQLDRFIEDIVKVDTYRTIGYD